MSFCWLKVVLAFRPIEGVAGYRRVLGLIELPTGLQMRQLVP